jgi:hypothetical protein
MPVERSHCRTSLVLWLQQVCECCPQDYHGVPEVCGRGLLGYLAASHCVFTRLVSVATVEGPRHGSL